MSAGTGVIEHLMNASRSWGGGREGLHTVVLDEMTLAPAEQFLGRALTAVETRQLRLYPDGSDEGQHPAALTLTPNVCWVGTVSTDERPAPLSSRVLARSAVVWVDPDVEEIFGRVDVPPSEAVSWRDVLRLCAERGDVDLGPLAPVARFLHERGIEGAPMARAITEARRYLAAAQGVLAPVTAVDFQVSQRVLPTLRGVGAEVGEVLSELEVLLRRKGLDRSSARVAKIRRRGRASGDFYDPMRT